MDEFAKEFLEILLEKFPKDFLMEDLQDFLKEFCVKFLKELPKEFVKPAFKGLLMGFIGGIAEYKNICIRRNFRRNSWDNFLKNS